MWEIAILVLGGPLPADRPAAAACARGGEDVRTAFAAAVTGGVSRHGGKARD